MELSSSPMQIKQKIGFIGGGKMALALGKGFMSSGLVSPGQVVTSAPSDTNLNLWRQLGANTTHKNLDVIRACDVIFLAVKPNVFPKVMFELENCEISGDTKLFVSVMAGISLSTLYDSLSLFVKCPRIIRTHPNTPATVGCGCAVYTLGHGATFEDGDLIRRLFNSVGLCEQVPEYQQDAFTGMAGSGPAYIYAVIEALSDGGVRMGLPRNIASKFAAQMTMGAAKMALESGQHTGILKDEVTSPGGTTIRGIQVLERAGIRGAFMDAVQAAAERAIEIGKK